MATKLSAIHTPKESSAPSASPRRVLPDTRSQRVRAHHRVAVLAAPRRLEFRHVRERAIHTPDAWRVRVGFEALQFRLRSLQAAPDLRPCEEETLLRRKSVDLCFGFTRNRFFH